MTAKMTKKEVVSSVRRLTNLTIKEKGGKTSEVLFALKEIEKASKK